MDRDAVGRAMIEAEEFVLRAKICLDNNKVAYCKESSALKRQSLELTRVLAEMRKP